MAVCEQEHASGLNVSERARLVLTSAVARLIGHDEKAGHHAESIFTAFWQLARKADDMMDYSASSDLKWLQMVQQVFRLCSRVQELPGSIPAAAWLRTTGRFFELMSMTCGGEVQDLLLARTPISGPRYEKMVILKTGPWFTGRIECAALAAGVETPGDLLEYGDLTCLAYQIRNDVRDAETEGKDAAIGKLNYPAILLLQNPALGRDQAIEKAARAADAYEERAMKIARRYGSELELLTARLCSSG